MEWVYGEDKFNVRNRSCKDKCKNRASAIPSRPLKMAFSSSLRVPPVAAFSSAFSVCRACSQIRPRSSHRKSRRNRQSITITCSCRRKRGTSCVVRQEQPVICTPRRALSHRRRLAKSAFCNSEDENRKFLFRIPILSASFHAILYSITILGIA